MHDYEPAMLAYAKLAAVSQERGQYLGRNRFLVLAGAAACRAGWPEVAERCRQLVLENNAAHLVGKSATFADALRDVEFQPFLKQLERLCPLETAEHLLRGLGLETGIPPGDSHDAGAFALALLEG
jgi:hypothetical protein